MVIDFHTHVFPDAIAPRTIRLLEEKSGLKAATDGTLQGLLDSLERCQADRAVILPVVTKPEQFTTILAFAEKVKEQHPEKLISFAGIHPDSRDYKKELKLVADAGLPGIKIHPDYQGVMIDDMRYMRILEYASELGLIVVTHAGVDIGMPDPVHCPPDKMRKVLRAVQPEKMVLAHYGGWNQWDEVEEYLAGENVWLDTSFVYDYITKEQFIQIYRKHDAGKILFATDSPWSDMAKGIQWIRSLALSEEETDNILSGNAMRLLGWT